MLIDKICGLRLFNNPSRNKSTRKARFRAAQTDGSGTTAQPQELTDSLMVFTRFLSETICVSHSHLCSLTWVSGSNQDLGHLYWAVWLISISYPHHRTVRLTSKVLLWLWQMVCTIFVLAEHDIIYLSFADRRPVSVTQGEVGQGKSWELKLYLILIQNGDFDQTESDFSRVPFASTVLTQHQENFFLQQIDYRKLQPIKMQLWSSIPTNTSTKHIQT